MSGVDYALTALRRDRDELARELDRLKLSAAESSRRAAHALNSAADLVEQLAELDAAIERLL